MMGDPPAKEYNTYMMQVNMVDPVMLRRHKVVTDEDKEWKNVWMDKNETDDYLGGRAATERVWSICPGKKMKKNMLRSGGSKFSVDISKIIPITDRNYSQPVDRDPAIFPFILSISWE